MSIELMRGIASCQARHTWLFVQIGTIGVAFGNVAPRAGLSRYAHRMEIMTPDHWFRSRFGKWAR